MTNLKALVLSFILLFAFNAIAQYHQLNKAIYLSEGSNEIHLEDYYLNYRNIRSAKLLNSNKALNLSNGKTTISNSSLKTFIDFIELTFSSKTEVIPVYKSLKKEVSISFPANLKDCKSMAVAGNFNGWSGKKNKLVKRGNNWTTTLLLNEGVYKYQLVCDEAWFFDPTNPKKTPNGYGDFNSLLDVTSEGEKPFLSSYRIMVENYGNKVKGPAAKERPKTRVNFKIDNSRNTTVYALWNNQIIVSKDVIDHNYFQIILPKEADNYKRSYVRIFAYNENGRANDLLIPISFGKIIDESFALNRHDIHQNIMYFAMVDRFSNGNRSNDYPLNDERVAKRADYHGGDLQGLINKYKEGYFEDLGINTLWISPITDNVDGAYQEYPEPRRYYSGYHGYWPKNNLLVDEHFGNNRDFETLVDVVHSKKHNILLDFVSNHVHEEHPLIQKNPNWKTNLYLENGDKNLRLWDEQSYTTWFDTFLPSLDFSNDAVVKTMVDTAYHWLNKYKIDGFRHDATKHIPNNYWRALTKKIKQNYLNNSISVFQIGETFGSRSLIGSYLGNGLLDGQFDFNLYFDLRDVLISEDETFTRIANSLTESINNYGSHNLMGNITGNHDLPRFIAYAGEAIGIDEDPKEVGWERDVQIKNKVGYQKLSLLHALIASFPGIPCIYYGDEIGLVGANDPDNRRPMKFSNLSQEELTVKSKLSQLLNIRKENIQFVFGSTKILYSDKDALVIERKYFDQIAVIAFNKKNSSNEIYFTLDDAFSQILYPQFESDSGNHNNEMYFSLPANGFEILLSR